MNVIEVMDFLQASFTAGRKKIYWDKKGWNDLQALVNLNEYRAENGMTFMGMKHYKKSSKGKEVSICTCGNRGYSAL